MPFCRAMRPPGWFRLIICSAVVTCASNQAAAQFVWDGSNNDNFGAAPNWFGNNVPAGAVLAPIIFGPEVAGNHVVTNMGSALTDITSLGFTGATGAYTISGSGAFGFSDGGTLLNDSGFAQTILVDLLGAGDSFVIDAAAGNLIIGGAVDLSDTSGVVLTVQGPNDTTINGVIGGAGGQLIKQDDGTLTLTAFNTFTGSAIINGGTLRLEGSLADTLAVILADAAGATLDLNGDDETIGSLSGGGGNGGNVVLGAALLTLGDANDTVFGGQISGAGGLTFVGSGSLTLSGANTYTGDTNINDGELILNGSVGGDVLINNGGTLSGIGSLAGNLVNASGATVAPGNSIGTLVVGGNYLQRAGSTLAIEINGANGASDLLDVTGTATLDAGSTILVSVDGAEFVVNGDTFDIIEADGGVADNGAQVDTVSATLEFTLQIDPNFLNGDTTYTLEAFRGDDAYSAPAEPGNNAAVGGALDSLIDLAEADPNGEVAGLLAQLDALSGAQLNEALNQLTPEVHNTATAIAIDQTVRFATAQSSYLRVKRRDMELAPTVAPSDPMAGAMASASDDPSMLASAIAALQLTDDTAAPSFEPGFGGYAEGYGAYSELDTQTNRTGYSADSYGFQSGIDYQPAADLLFGVAFGYDRTDADLNGDRGDIEAQTFRVGPYLIYAPNEWYLISSVTFGFSEFDARRGMPALGRTARADYDGYDVSAFLEGGYDFDLGENWTITPTTSLQYGYFEHDSFTETGAAAANLKVRSRDSDSLRSRVGASLTGRFGAGGKSVISEFFVGWEHEFLDNSDIAYTSFNAGGSTFSIDTGSREEDSLFYGARVTIPIKQNARGYLSVNGRWSDGADAVGISGGLMIEF